MVTYQELPTYYITWTECMGCRVSTFRRDDHAASQLSWLARLWSRVQIAFQCGQLSLAWSRCTAHAAFNFSIITRPKCILVRLCGRNCPEIIIWNRAMTRQGTWYRRTCKLKQKLPTWVGARQVLGRCFVDASRISLVERISFSGTWPCRRGPLQHSTVHSYEKSAWLASISLCSVFCNRILYVK